jgi:hypothetical protein
MRPEGQDVPVQVKPTCRCYCSTGIHEGLTFGSGELDFYGYWEHPCSKCARWHEQEKGLPLNTYWPFEQKEKIWTC